MMIHKNLNLQVLTQKSNLRRKRLQRMKRSQEEEEEGQLHLLHPHRLQGKKERSNKVVPVESNNPEEEEIHQVLPNLHLRKTVENSMNREDVDER